jgi:hypothetical protein
MKKLLTVVFLFISFLSYAQIKGTYAIKNVETGMVLRIKDANTADGTPIVAYSPVNWKCVTWDFKQVEGDTYELKNLFSGKTMQSTGNKLEEKPMKDIPEQQYKFIPVENNEYLIRLNDLYITDHKGSILLAKKDNSKSQHWVLVEQHPTM